MTIATNRYLQALKTRDRTPPPPLPTKPERTPLPPDSFGAVLAELRHATHLSQARFAKLANLDHSNVSRYESGDRFPAFDTVHAMADALALSDGDRDRLLHAANFRTGSALPLLSCPALAALDDAHRAASPARKACIERLVTLALDWEAA